MQLFSRISSCRDVYSLQALLTDVAAVTNRAGQTRRSEVSGLDIFFDQYALPEESRRFFASTLPFIAKLAAHLKQEVGDVVGIPVKSGGEHVYIVENCSRTVQSYANCWCYEIYH